MSGESFSFPEDLREAEKHFELLVYEVRDYAIFILDSNGIVRSWNAGAQHIKGYLPHEIIGQPFTRFYLPDAIATGFPQEELRQAAIVGRFEDEGWRLRKDGTRFWANVVINTIYGKDRKVLGYLKITRDLSERRKAEESLRVSEERFRLLVDGVQEYGIFMLDPEGHITSWNSGAQRINGYTADEITGKHFSIFYSSEDVAAGKPALELETAKKYGTVEDEGWRVRKDRSLFWANVVVTAMYDSERRLRGFAKVTRDMTDRRAAEELQAADRQKNEFLAMLAHELRNPLAPISNGLQLLSMPALDADTLQETTRLMRRQMDHLVRLVDDLLDVSRIITGKISLHQDTIELSAVVARAVEEVQSAIDARGHELMVTLPSRPISVHGDLVRLSQVFTNLLSNAARYSPEPGQIWLSAERRGDIAVIRVRDTGVGIPAELLPNIFDLFVQADNSLARKQGGLGIGLTLVKRIVELHGGHVSVSSAGPGKGSEFTVELAVADKQKKAEEKPRPAQQRTMAEPKRILVVDDNVDAAATVAKLLMLWGHDVHVVFDGKAALESVSTFRPDIILLDIGLPGMSGYDVARQIRSDPKSQGLVITALTGYGRTEDRQRSIEAGFDFHITKPLGSDVLEALVTRSGNFARSDRDVRDADSSSTAT